MTKAHRMLAATRITTTAIVTPKPNSVPSSPMIAHLVNAMVILVVAALEFKGSPTTMQTLIRTTESPLEVPSMITRGGLTMWH